MAIKEIPSEEREDDDSLLWMIKQISEDRLKFVWPCLISVFIQAGIFEHATGEEVKDIGMSLQSATPKTFNSLLSYDQKIKILLFLCNSCHDFTAYRDYISERLKEKHKYSKEKQETYTEIRKIEQQKRKHMEEHANSDFVLNEGVKDKIVILEEDLKNASRTQAKAIRDELNSLTKEKANYRSTLHKHDEKIELLNSKIARLNDSLFKVSVKVSIIGHDLENEYWFFKDDVSKLYVKDLITGQWSYYSDENSIMELENSLLTKGIKERKLYEGLRKLRGKMRIK
jgi:glucan-binding YG repeat protein